MDRDAATRRVMLSIAVGPQRVELPYTAADGSKPLVVATPNENMSAVIERVEAIGGSANIALAEARKFTIFTIEGEPAPSEPSENEATVNKDMSMGMFWLKQKNRNGHFFRLRNAEAKFPAVSQEFAYAN
jgi:hypothetical protein